MRRMMLYWGVLARHKARYGHDARGCDYLLSKAFAQWMRHGVAPWYLEYNRQAYLAEGDWSW